MNTGKILIVDDEKDARSLLKAILKQANYTIQEASSGEQALKIMSKNTPDLVILDVRMPGMDGYQVCYEIRNDERLKNVPVIMLTVMGDKLDKLRGLHLGTDDYIIKPFEPEEILAKINTILGRKRFYEDASMTDGLTGLYNILFFKKQMDIFFNMAIRTEKEFSLAVIDVDNFKEINDKHGHVVGDYVLRRVAGILNQTLRKSDIITRYGGDEFAVILPELNKSQAAATMKKLKSRVKKEDFVSEKTDRKFNVSLSIGVASWNAEYENASQMFDAADSEMYKDKKIKD